MLRQNGCCHLTSVVVILAFTISARADEVWAPPARTYSIAIRGMTCQTCSDHVQKELAAVSGVVKAAVDYKAGHAWVTVQEPRQPVSASSQRRIGQELAAAVARAGYQPTVNYVLTVKGMTCEGCSQHITTAVAKVPGVAAASVNYKGGYAVIVPAANAAPLVSSLLNAVEQAGYKAVVHSGP